MSKANLFLAIGIILAGINYARAAGPATQPTTQPALQESAAVRVNGLDFQIVTPAVWVPPAPKKVTTIPLQLKVTNHTGKPVQLDLFDKLMIQMHDASGKEVPIDGGRNGTCPCPPLIIAKEQSGTVDRTAKLKPSSNHPGSFRLIGSDGAGGIWYFDGLAAGKYTIRMTYENDPEAPHHATAQAAGADAPPVWVGKAVTKDLAVEIADPKSAHQP